MKNYNNKEILRQHNAITEARYEMSALEKNILYLLMAELSEEDESHKDYFINFDDLQERTPEKIKMPQLIKASEKLVTRVYSIKKANGGILDAALVSSVKNYPELKKIRLRVGSMILPYLISLKKNYTEFELEMALRLKSKYSKRLFEMLSQHKDIGTFLIDIKTLKYRLNLIDEKRKKEKYQAWSMFEKEVLKEPQNQIEKITNISFSYTLIKEGNKNVAIEFTIRKKASQLKLF